MEKHTQDKVAEHLDLIRLAAKQMLHQVDELENRLGMGIAAKEMSVGDGAEKVLVKEPRLPKNETDS